MKLKQKFIGIITAIFFTVNACIGGMISFIAEAAVVGVAVGNATVKGGIPSVELPLSLVGDLTSYNCVVSLTCDYPLEIVSFPGAFAEDIQSTSAAATYIAPEGLATNFGSVEIGIADDAEPGTYPVNISVEVYDENGERVKKTVGYSGSVTIVSEEPSEIIDPSLVTKYGDSNIDGTVDVADVVQLNLYILNPKTNSLDGSALANSDCSRDGTIDSADSALILNYVSMVVSYESLGTKKSEPLTKIDALI